MIDAQLVPLSIPRGAPRVFTIQIIGANLTGADLHAQLRLYPDAAGDPLLDLPLTTSATSAGVRLMDVDTSGTLPISFIRLQIPAMATGGGAGQLPPADDPGNNLAIAWDLFITPTGQTTDRWFYGPVAVEATVTKFAALPELKNDPLPGVDAVANLTGINLTVTLEGAGLIAPLLASADGSAGQAIVARDEAVAARNDAQTAAQTAQEQVGLALPKAGGNMTGPIGMGGNPVTTLGPGSLDDHAVNLGQMNQALAGKLNNGAAVSTLVETDTAKIMTSAERTSLGGLNARTDLASTYFEDTDRISIDPSGRVAQFVRAGDSGRFGKLSITATARIAPAYDPASGQTTLDIAPNSAIVTAAIADYWEGASRVVMNMAGQILYAAATSPQPLTASGSLTASIVEYWEGTQRLSTNLAGAIVAFVAVPAPVASSAGVAALATRIDSVVDPAGAPTAHLIGGRYLREFAYRRSQILDDAAAITIQVVIGPADSYTRLRTWARNMARKWRLELGNGGPGWTGAYEASSGTTPGTTTGNIDPAEMAVGFTGSGWSHQYLYGDGSPDNCTSTSGTAGDRITFTYSSTLYGAASITFASLFTTKTFLGPNGTGGGVIRYRWNGGAWTNIDLTANSYGISSPLANIPAGNSWTLDVEIVSGTVAIAGLNALTGIQPGIVVHDLAVSGSDLYRWAGAGVASFRAHAATAITALANGTPITAFIAPISTNDQTYSRSYDDFQAAMETWIDSVARAVSPGCDILWIAPPENGRDVATFPQRIAGYTARAKIVQASRQIALIDMQPIFGTSYAEYGDTGTRRQLIGSDRLHPTDSGGALYRSTARNALTNRS